MPVLWGSLKYVTELLAHLPVRLLISQKVQHCTPETPYEKTMALTNLVTCLDVVTDLMSLSIISLRFLI
jgi:hypothetical protein